MKFSNSIFETFPCASTRLTRVCLQKKIITRHYDVPPAIFEFDHFPKQSEDARVSRTRLHFIYRRDV